MEPPNVLDPFEKLKYDLEKVTRNFEDSVNRHTSTLMRQPPNPNELEVRKAGTASYISKPNATRLMTPKTSKAHQQAAETAKIFAKLAAQATAIRRDNTEQKALHDARRTEILAKAAATNREFRIEMNARIAELALAELTLAEKQAAKQEAAKVDK